MTAPARRRPAIGGYAPEEPASVALVKKAIAAVVACQLVISLAAGYRAYFQVWRLELHAPASPVLRAGEKLGARVVSSGRAPGQLRLELAQGARVETLAVHPVTANRLSFYDPRPHRDSLAVTLAPETLARFHAGPAVLRAVGSGSSEWLRVPPPEVRERAVELRPPGAPER